ncbi:HNH endonuclease signature motif containing protein [Streptomyces longwoodensis]|uniref:HNH endonuclease signature motif containing protein n=1 Tax=Streptomyces longwoodensis TaxID=68231 RepID=UPI0033C8E9A0
METTSACKPWTGRTNGDGYGMQGKYLAHRVAWQNERGPIPEGMTLDHTCHDPAVCRLGKQCPHRRCVNVDHLELCTADENKTRGGAGLPQLAKVSCPQGHPYAGANLLVSGGKRLCRTCRREKLRARREVAKRQRCEKAGHTFTPEVDAEGKTYCAVCRAATAREVGTRNRRTHCPKGHEYTPENSYVSGEYVKCRHCNRDAMAARAAKKRERHAEEKGHAYSLVEDVNGKPYCLTCRRANPGPGKAHR